MRLRMKSKLLLTGLVLALFNPSAQAATTIAAQPCDAAYWQSMSSRAWMEAEREIAQNQNLIFKPDSVFEYTCFDRILAHTATHAGKIFSHTEYFGERIIEENDALGLRNSLGEVVYEALKVFINDNFEHKFLGDRALDMSANSADTNMALDPTPAGETALYEGSYGTCKIMKDIWATSKCANFVDNSNFDGSNANKPADGFYPFDALKNASGGVVVAGYRDTIQDPRRYPSQEGYRCGTLSTGMGNWSDNIRNATNTSTGGSDVLYPFKGPLEAVFTDVYDKTKPGDCSQPAIPTGVMVYTREIPEGYLDGVCANPGCTYTAGTDTTLGSCD